MMSVTYPLRRRRPNVQPPWLDFCRCPRALCSATPADSTTEAEPLFPCASLALLARSLRDELLHRVFGRRRGGARDRSRATSPTDPRSCRGEWPPRAGRSSSPTGTTITSAPSRRSRRSRSLQYTSAVARRPSFLDARDRPGTPARAISSRTSRTCCWTAASSSSSPGSTIDVLPVPGHSPAALAFRITSPDGDGLSSSATCSSRARVGRTDFAGRRLARCSSESIARLLRRRAGPRRRAARATAPPRRSAAERADEPVPRRRRERPLSDAFQSPRRHAGLAAAAHARCAGAWSSAREQSSSAPASARSSTPMFEDTGLFAAHERRGLRRRAEGDVLLHGPRRAAAHACAPS